MLFNEKNIFQYLMFICGVGAGAVVAVQLTVPGFFSTDTWWHLAAGKWIWTHHSITNHDPFSWSLPGAKWTNQEWLFQVLLHISQKGGVYGVIIFCIIPLLVTLYLLWKLAGQKSNPLFAGFIFVATILMVMPGITARPQLFDFTFFAFILWAYSTGKIKLFYTIPMVILLWANMHGAVLLGMAVVLLQAVLSLIPAFSLGGITHNPGDKKVLWTVTVFSFLASMVTPWGISLYHYVLATISDKIFQQYILEWMPPPFGSPLTKYTTVLAVVLIVIGLLVIRSPVRLSTLLVCGGLFYEALTQFRFYPLWGIAMAPLLGEIFVVDERNNGKLVVAGVVVGLLTGSLVGGGIPDSIDKITRSEGYPVDAVAHIRTGEKVLNPYNWGGYLTYRGIPVFIDGRADVYRFDGDVFKDYMEDTSKLQMKDLLDKYKPDVVLMETGSLVAKYMDMMPSWKETYRDKNAVIYRPAG